MICRTLNSSLFFRFLFLPVQIKNIVHVWEVGHLTSSLVSATMTGASLTHSPHHLTILMMLDLSQPEILWSSFEEALSVIRNAMKMSYDDKMIQELRHRRATERKRVLEKEVDPFPIKLCIVGGKYDKFKVSCQIISKNICTLME